MHNTPTNNELLTFNANNEFELQVQLEQETVWLTQKQMCLLFDKSKSSISEHIKNVFSEGELIKEMVVRNFRTTTQHGAIKGKTQTKEVIHYNLDVIISVGYRVKSLRGTQFRIWATKRLKEYLIKGYAINEQQLEKNKTQLLKVLDDLKSLTKDTVLLDNQDVLSLVKHYADTWFTLDSFDKSEFPEQGIEEHLEISSDELYQDLAILKKELINRNEATVLFAQEKREGSFAGILKSVFQTVFGQDAYPSIEEKTAHLLYFVVKNHPFNDGNKRSGAFAFVWLLRKFNYDFYDKINPQTLAALTLLIAESAPSEKEKMIGLVKLLIKN